MNGGDGLFAEEGVIYPCNFKMVIQVIRHALSVNSFEVAPCHDTRGQWQRCLPVEFIEQIILSGQDDGKNGLGVSLKLSQGVEFGKHFQSQQRGLV